MIRTTLQLLGLLSLLLPGLSLAVPLRADYLVNFHPPNPCSDTTLGDLSDATLGGTMRLYYQNVDSGELLEANPGPPNISDIACSGHAAGSVNFDLDFDAGAYMLFLSFDGVLETSPGPPTTPVYALLPGSDVNVIPDTVPLLALGLISNEINPGPPDLPLYAFASPGHEIGTLAISFSSVPEPASFALLLGGILILCQFRRQGCLNSKEKKYN